MLLELFLQLVNLEIVLLYLMSLIMMLGNDCKLGFFLRSKILACLDAKKIMKKLFYFI